MRFECLLEWGSCNVRPKDRGVRGPAKLNRVHPASLHDLRARWPSSLYDTLKIGQRQRSRRPARRPGGRPARRRARARGQHFAHRTHRRTRLRLRHADRAGETPWKISSCQDRTPHSLLASLTGECVYMVVSGVKGTGSPAMPAAIEHAVHETRRGRRQCVSSLGARRARARGCARTGSRKARHRLTEQPLPLIAAWPPARPPRCRTGRRGAPRRRVFPRRATPRRRQRLAARGAVVGAGS